MNIRSLGEMILEVISILVTVILGTLVIGYMIAFVFAVINVNTFLGIQLYSSDFLVAGFIITAILVVADIIHAFFLTEVVYEIEEQEGENDKNE